MKKSLLALVALGAASTASLSARELLCEQCVPEPECWEHLFVERCQWFVHGEFLYWGVAEGDLEYANVSTKSNNLDSDSLLGDYKTADFDFGPGFRVAASYYNCPKYWEISLQYTWMHNSGKDSVSDPEGTGILNPTRQTNIGRPFVNASSKIEHDYQLGDLYVARVFDPNAHLRMRVYAGVTLGYLKQEWDVSYTNSIDIRTVDQTDWRFFGGGFRLGVTADWFWGCQFYLTGRASFATLYGGYKNERNYVISNDDQVIACTKYDDPRFAYHTQIMMGPSWQVPCDCWSFELFAGYEMNLWFNLKESIFALPGSTGDGRYILHSQSVLGMHGLTLRLTLGF